jgi:hypothetical protein
MSDEKRTLRREYCEAHGTMRFGWSVAKLFEFDDPVMRELRSAFMWQQKDDDDWWQWMVKCTRTNPPHTYTCWGTQEQCLAEASKWLECTVVMEGDDE